MNGNKNKGLKLEKGYFVKRSIKGKNLFDIVAFKVSDGEMGLIFIELKDQIIFSHGEASRFYRRDGNMEIIDKRNIPDQIKKILESIEQYAETIETLYEPKMSKVSLLDKVRHVRDYYNKKNGELVAKLL